MIFLLSLYNFILSVPILNVTEGHHLSMCRQADFKGKYFPDGNKAKNVKDLSAFTE